MIGFVSLSNGVAGETIRLSTGEWNPYTGEDFKYFGVTCRVIIEAFALEGVKAEIEFLPWGRSMAVTVEGDRDGTFPWLYKSERAEELYLSDEIMMTRYVFYHLKSYKFDWKTVKDLEGIDIGATVEWFYGDEFEKAEKTGKISVERAYSNEINFKKLFGNRIKLFPLEPDGGNAILNKEFTAEERKRLTYHPRSFEAKPLYLMLSKKDKKNERLIKLFNKGLKRLRESGKYDQYHEESRRGDYIIKK